MELICNAGEQPITLFLSNALSFFLKESTLDQQFYKPSFITSFSARMESKYNLTSFPRGDSPVYIHQKNEATANKGMLLKSPFSNFLSQEKKQKESSSPNPKETQENKGQNNFTSPDTSSKGPVRLMNSAKSPVSPTEHMLSKLYSIDTPTRASLRTIQKASDQEKSHSDLLNMLRMKPQPVLPPKKAEPEYTLVLDLDETLIHFERNSEHGGEFLIRPFAQDLLQELSSCFEIVIFTASTQSYADWILDRIDKGKCISHRLYRQHMIPLERVGYFKDLRLLGRDLSKTIIVDNNPSNFRLQPANGIKIKSWFNDKTDRALLNLCSALKSKVC
jgi:Dullard-like phosphatase family protein